MTRFVTLSLSFLLVAPAVLAQTVTPLWERAFPKPRSIAAAPDGARVVVGDGALQASSFIFLDAVEGDTLDLIRTTTEPVYPEVFMAPEMMAFGPDGRTVVAVHHAVNGTGGGTSEHGTGSSGVDLRLWDPDAPDGEERQYVLNSGTQSLAAADGLLFHARGGFDSVDNTYVRDIGTTAALFSENNEHSPIYAAFSPDAETLVTIHDFSDDAIRVRQRGVWTADIMRGFGDLLIRPLMIDFAPDGSRAVVSTRGYFTDAGLYVYDTSDWSLERFIAVPPGLESGRNVRGVFSDDGRHLVGVERLRQPNSSVWDVQITVHEVETGELLMNQPITASAEYPRVPPADIKRVPGTGRFVWFGNDRAGVFEMNPDGVVADEAGPGADAGRLAVAPNPAASAAEVTFRLAETGEVSLTVHDLLGRTVATLASASYGAGEHRQRLDTAALPSGVYVVRLATAGAVQTQRLVVAR